MIVSESFLFVLVLVALVLSAVAPVILLALLIRDWRAGALW